MARGSDPAMPAADCERLLAEEDTGVLAMDSPEGPYALPLSYAFIAGTVVIHTALAGRKLDALRGNPRVCLSVSRHPERTRPHGPEGECTYRYESVLVFGRARVVEVAAERLPWLEKFKAHFDARLGLAAEKNPVTAKAAEHCGVILITPERISGRRRA